MKAERVLLVGKDEETVIFLVRAFDFDATYEKPSSFSYVASKSNAFETTGSNAGSTSTRVPSAI